MASELTMYTGHDKDIDYMSAIAIEGPPYTSTSQHILLSSGMCAHRQGVLRLQAVIIVALARS